MKLGLALGGGGARGAAHIGAMIEMERLGVAPKIIAGTSIGGIIGVLLASGMSTDAITMFFTKLNLSQLYSFPGRASGFSGTAKIERLLIDTIGRPTFDNLQTPLALVACDLISRKMVVLDEGDVVQAVLATIAIPILLPPVEHDGMVLVDGGLLNNMPFDIVRARGATHVIAVDLTNSAPFGTPAPADPAPSGVLERALSLTQRQKTWQILTAVLDIVTTQSLSARLAVGQPDIFLQPNLGTIGLFDFHRWQEGIELGQKAAQEAAGEIRKIVRKLTKA